MEKLLSTSDFKMDLIAKIMKIISKVYTSDSEVYKSTRRSLRRFTIEELHNLYAMIRTSI